MPDLWRVVEAPASADGSSLTVVFDGMSKENVRDVIVRNILTRYGNRLHITKQTHMAGEPFLMRLSYELQQR